MYRHRRQASLLKPCLVLEQLSPDLLLTSTRSDELFMDAVRDKGSLSILPFTHPSDHCA